MLNKLKQFFKKINYRYYISIFVIAILIVGGAIYILRAPKIVEAEWFNDAWHYRRLISVTNNTSTENGVYISVTIDTSDTSKFQADCDDLRFTNSVGNKLNYYLVSGCSTATTIVHIYLNSFKAGLQNIYYYYGNLSATKDALDSDFSTEASNYTVGATASEEKSEVPVAYWSFDEGYGIIAHDNTSNQNNGSLTNMSTTGTSTAWVDGKFGKGLRFDGEDDYVLVGDPAGTDLDMRTDDFSIELWIKTKQIPSTGSNRQGAIFINEKNMGGANLSGYSVGMGLTGKLTVWLAYNDARNAIKSNIGPILNDGQWHQIILNFDRDANLIYYLDAQNVYQGDISVLNGDDIQGTDLFKIGGGVTGYYKWDNFMGSLDEIKIYHHLLTAEQIRQSYSSRVKSLTGLNLSQSKQDQRNARADALVDWWKLDEDSWNGNANEVIDSSGFGHHGLAYNGANTTSTARYGRAGEFDGADDYLSFDTDDTATESTYCFWLNSSDPSNYHSVFSHGTNDRGAFAINWLDKPLLHMGNDNYRYWVNNTAQDDGQWHFWCVYIAGAQQKDIDNSKLYIDGVEQEVDSTKDTGLFNSYSSGLVLGKGGSYYFHGLLDDFKLWHRALSAQEISKEYNEGPAPVGYWSMDKINGSTVIDQSGNGNDGTMSNMSKKDNQKPGKVGSALDFYNYCYLNLGNQTILNNQRLTLSAWWKPDENLAIWGGSLITKGTGSEGTIAIQRTTNNEIRITANYYKSNQLIWNTHVNYIPNQWQFITLTYDGAYFRLYIDGKLVASHNYAHILEYDSESWTIGADLTGGNEYFDGLIDEVKVFNYALSPYQIAQEYNGGQPIAYWSFNEGEKNTIHNESDNAYHATLNLGTTGNTSLSTAWQSSANCKERSCLEFDGVDDYVEINKAIEFADNQEWSLSTWVYNPSTTDADILSNNIDNKLVIYEHQNGCRIYNTGGSNYADLSKGLPLNQWTLLTIVNTGADSNNIIFYLNGQEENVDTLVDSSIKFNIIAKRYNDSSSVFFGGRIDEFKVFNYALSPEDVKRDYNFAKALYFK